MPFPIFETKQLNDEARKAAGGSFVSLPDGITHYEISNPEKEDIVVFVHGFSVPYFIFDPTFEFLTHSGLCALRYDLFGRGFSDRPRTRFRIDLFVNQLAGLLDALRFTRPVNLIGLSMGGPITATFTAHYPERVRSLTFIDPAGAKPAGAFGDSAAPAAGASLPHPPPLHAPAAMRPWTKTRLAPFSPVCHEIRRHLDDGILLSELVHDAGIVVRVFHPDAVDDEPVLVLSTRDGDDGTPHAIRTALQRDPIETPVRERAGDAHFASMRGVEAEAYTPRLRLGSTRAGLLHTRLADAQEWLFGQELVGESGELLGGAAGRIELGHRLTAAGGLLQLHRVADDGAH